MEPEPCAQDVTQPVCDNFCCGKVGRNVTLYFKFEFEKGHNMKKYPKKKVRGKSGKKEQLML